MESKFEIVPIAQFAKGLFLKGRKTGEAGKQIKLTDKKSGHEYSKYIHEFNLLDCSDDMKFSARNEETRKYEEMIPMEGAKVAVWASKSLHEKLEMFPEDSVLKITEVGLEAAGGEFKRRKFDVKLEKETK